MKVHELKTDPDVFKALVGRLKNFEIRKNDRDYGVGDLLHLRETEHTGQTMKEYGWPCIYTGQEVFVKVKYILIGPVYGLADGWCIMSVAPVIINEVKP